MGGSGPSSPARSFVPRERASSAVLPLINSVARLATAMAVSHPNDWNVALSMTFLPRSSLYLIHIRSISPHCELPTVPTESASGNSPRFCGFLSASSICFCKLSFIESINYSATKKHNAHKKLIRFNSLVCPLRLFAAIIPIYTAAVWDPLPATTRQCLHAGSAHSSFPGPGNTPLRPTPACLGDQ